MSRSVFRKCSEDPRRSCSKCPEIKVVCWTDCYSKSGWTRTPQILMPQPLLRTMKERAPGRERDGGKNSPGLGLPSSSHLSLLSRSGVNPLGRSSPGVGLPSSSHLSLLSRSGVNSLQSSASTPYLNTCVCVCVCLFWKLSLCVCVCGGKLPFPPEYLPPPAERRKKERKTKAPKHKKETSGKVVAPLAANNPTGPTAPPTSSASFNWVPRQMLSGDAAEEEGESDGDSDSGDNDRGEGEEADLVIDIPNK
ncbi:uncharacterized protein LOC129838074 isoform X1 [Salvelinus fontinalis]|uniref:uncharacterized protein LOC129838074 isoform X1 n=1 Tax=Salvelinus fontinalis TaxID=8038 RepID=UPI002485A9BC|nr:uncharacterized protein LOC129838074 isoform X1 [Salvelinus fontinalis]XP_055760737.1 uncharacterized protein LOC129838074 isoform X1 [Salvelinus fontinalis]